jgi:hypothetical protein
MLRLLLGFLLFHANRDPLEKKSFYAIKERLLRRYGKKVGADVQHLAGVRCNRCDRGRHWHWIYDWHGFGYESCWHCDGTGWYKPERWVLLLRIQVGGHIFHRPVSTAYYECWLPPTVRARVLDGYVKHPSSPFHLSRECCLWLYLFFDRERFRKEMRLGIGCEHYFTPFVAWQNYLFLLRQDWPHVHMLDWD